MNKIIKSLIAAAMAIQLLFSAGMIVYAKNIDNYILKKGNEYKFEVIITSVSNGEISYILCSYFDYSDVEITTSSNGFSQLVNAKKPFGKYDYIKKANIQLFLTSYDTKTAYNIFYSDLKEEKPKGYITAKVYKGNLVITGLYINNIPATQWLEQNHS